MPLFIFFLNFAFMNSNAGAATVDRDDSIRQAQVWVQPSWIKSNYIFDSSFDIAGSPDGDLRDLPLLDETVRCEMNKKSMKHKLGGKTRKMYCELKAADLARRDIVKFKYKHIDGEVPGEILGTRLLWALGFGADRMFPVETLECFGCTEDPFFDRRIDSSPDAQPRRFSRAAAERKFPGKEIKSPTEGWRFNELMNLLPTEPAAHARAVRDRDALRLLAVFMRHADNKGPNQSVVCDGDVSSEGGCSGQTTMYIQDIGTSFGYGTSEKRVPSKVNLREWQNVPIWRNAEQCVAELGPNDCQEMETPQISREGHTHLSRLLLGFVAGPEGRARVKKLFEMAHAEDRGGSVDEWTDVFLSKVQELADGCGGR